MMKFVRKQRMIWYAINKTRKSQKIKAWNTWRNNFKSEMYKVALFNRALIDIKNNIIRGSFKALQLHTLKRRLNRRGVYHHMRKL